MGRTPKLSGRNTPVVPSPGIAKVEAPPTAATKPGAKALAPAAVPSGLRSDPYHQQRIEGRGPSAMLAVRATKREPEYRTPPAQAFRDMVNDARGLGESNRSAAAHHLLDAVQGYLRGGETLNRTGRGAELLAKVDNEERVPLLRRAVHALRRAGKDGVLPPQAMAEVRDLARMSQGMGWNFDWDDNIANMQTKLLLFNNKDGSEREVSTQEFAVIREQIGKPGPWEHFAVRGDDNEEGSFRNFRDLKDPGVFARDLKDIMSKKGWKGPSYEAFQKAMSHPLTAAWSTIITARGHFPATIHAELERLKGEGHIEHVPPKENIFPVTLDGLAERLGGGKVDSPSESKIRVMETYLDRLNAAPMGPSSRLVVAPEAKEAKQYLHLWGFSDDDYGTFEKTVASLGQDFKQGRWPNMKITVFFTGTNHPDVKPHAVVLQPDGTARPQLPEEGAEADVLLARMASYQERLGGGAPAKSATRRA